MSTVSQPDFVNIGEHVSAKVVCKRLNISRSTLWRMRREDQTFPPPVAVSKRSVRFAWQAIEHWIRAKGSAASCN